MIAQGPYMAARVGVEPTTLRLKAIDSTKAPPCPTAYSNDVLEYAVQMFTAIFSVFFF